MRHRLLGLVAVSTGAVVYLGAPAAADITGDGITCKGSAVITGDDGTRVTVTEADSRVTVPRDGTAAYTGSVTPATHDHSGEVVVDLGFYEAKVKSWGPSANAANDREDTGTVALPDVFAYVPPGEYVLRGKHSGTEGSCAGSVVLVVEGGLLSSPAGLVGLVGALLTGAVVLTAGRRS